MIITMNKETFKVDRREDGMFNLKQVEKAWKGGGGKGGALNDWKRKSSVTDMAKLGKISLVNKDGKYGGTWGCK